MKYYEQKFNFDPSVTAMSGIVSTWTPSNNSARFMIGAASPSLEHLGLQGSIRQASS